MLKVTAQGIDELKNILEQMKCSGCGDEPMPSESSCGSHCDCGCEGHADVDDECLMDELALRLIVTGNKDFGLIPDILRDGDQVIERDGVKLLLIDNEIAEAVKGLILDCVDVPGGRSLTFTAGQA